MAPYGEAFGILVSSLFGLRVEQGRFGKKPQPLRLVCQEDDRGIADFTLVDFGVMFKFIEMEEAKLGTLSARHDIM